MNKRKKFIAHTKAIENRTPQVLWDMDPGAKVNDMLEGLGVDALLSTEAYLKQHSLSVEYFQAIYHRKFAELIINECKTAVANVRISAIQDFEISGRKDLDKFIVDTSAVALLDAIDKHFGVTDA